MSSDSRNNSFFLSFLLSDHEHQSGVHISGICSFLNLLNACTLIRCVQVPIWYRSSVPLLQLRAREKVPTGNL